VDCSVGAGRAGDEAGAGMDGGKGVMAVECREVMATGRSLVGVVGRHPVKEKAGDGQKGNKRISHVVVVWEVYIKVLNLCENARGAGSPRFSAVAGDSGGLYRRVIFGCGGVL